MSRLKTTFIAGLTATTIAGAQAEGSREVTPRLSSPAVATATQEATQALMTQGGERVLVAQAKGSAWVPNPEYDRIITEAKTAGKDVLKFAKSKVGNEWTMDDYINFSRYNRSLQYQAAIERRNGEKEIDQAAIEDQKRIEGKKQAAIELETKRQLGVEQLNAQAMRNLQLAKQASDSGKTLPTNIIDFIIEVYNDPIFNKNIKDYIVAHFSPVLKSRNVQVASK